jgi:hypothetical protein
MSFAGQQADTGAALEQSGELFCSMFSRFVADDTSCWIFS